MDSKNFDLAKKLVAKEYIDTAQQAFTANQTVLRSILAQRRLPKSGLADIAIERLLADLSLMDSNNFPDHVGAGEREGRVINEIVRRRHFYMSHGIGRSGDITANQPKAAGSSLMLQLANLLALDAVRLAGAPGTESALILPMATGMSLALVLRAIAGDASLSKVRAPDANVVIWPRIDQKTCLKCIYAAGFVAAPVELRKAPISDESVSDPASLVPFFLRVHPEDVDAAIERIGAHRVVCVLSTTSCFAPRLPDDTLMIGRVCQKHDVPYVVNNAYGIQSMPLMKRLNSSFSSANAGSRLDCFVQSTDKNFCVPVGGSVVAGPAVTVAKIAATFAGRASAAPIMDLFITLLGIGQDGFSQLLRSRHDILSYFHERARKFAEAHGESLLTHPDNDISFALTLTRLADPILLGARLMYRGVTGPRIVAPSTSSKTLCGHSFQLYGTHHDDANVPLLVMAGAIGMRPNEVDVFFTKLEATWCELLH